MGIYDDVVCQYPLPEIKTSEGDVLTLPQSPGFQTKDLECSLTKYIIKPDGSLWQDKVQYETIPEEERGIWPHSAFLREVSRKMVPKHHHGYFDFYTGWKDSQYSYWVCFIVKYTDGVLQFIDVKEATKKSIPG